MKTPPKSIGTELRFFGISDIGLNRPTNQDFWSALPDIGFFALADGMGGRKGGEIAAREAIESLGESIRRLAIATNFFEQEEELSREFLQAIEQANLWVYQMGCDIKPLSGMGTTLACLLWTRRRIYCAHVGDSRIYRFRQKSLELLTRDHSLFARWLAKKKMEGPSPPKNIITRAIGTKGRANPEIASLSPLPGDLFLLCSDGLSDFVPRPDLESILASSQNPSEAARSMIERAKNKGSSDNITALIIAS